MLHELSMPVWTEDELRSEVRAMLDRDEDGYAVDADECDAPADWQSGAITFDPYV